MMGGEGFNEEKTENGITMELFLSPQEIPHNIFIIATCNPHRGNSLATHTKEALVQEENRFFEISQGINPEENITSHQVSSMGSASDDSTQEETFLKGTYFVQKLHPTLDLVTWNYGALDEFQENAYVRAKLSMLEQEMDILEAGMLTNLICGSQNLMRSYAKENLINVLRLSEEDAEMLAKSSVSQRDIQRVFTIYEWLTKLYQNLDPHNDDGSYHRRAIMVSLGIVYYMRLTESYREKYKLFLDKLERNDTTEVNFSTAYQTELDWFLEQFQPLPPGIAKTQALKENIMAIIICCITNIPLIIVGHPGSSKTLSFNMTVSSMKGKESKIPVFRNIDVFRSLDPHFYQCSRRTTSIDVEKVFIQAINRQKSIDRIKLPVKCIVFMDEAGLPEVEMESLKVLHYYLDRKQVSFVAITNHMLDAAKTNRAISLFRPRASIKELDTIASDCLSTVLNAKPSSYEAALVGNFCTSYLQIMKNPLYKMVFGMRDFIHFIFYLSRSRKVFISPQLVLEALERNFNGSGKFEELCNEFLKKVRMYYLYHEHEGRVQFKV